MKALFDIRGKQLVVETDSSCPIDVVRVHSLDSFATWINSLDEAPPAALELSNGVRHPRKSTQRKHQRKVAAASAAEIAEMTELALTRPPNGRKTWLDDSGKVIILTNRGVTRERVALAMAKHAGKLSVEEQTLIAQRYGLLDVKRPHSLQEVAVMVNEDYTSVSGQITKALKRIGLRFGKRNYS